MTDQMRAKISFQGEKGANSDSACRDMFPDMEPLPCATFEDAAKASSNVAQGSGSMSGNMSRQAESELAPFSP